MFYYIHYPLSFAAQYTPIQPKSTTIDTSHKIQEPNYITIAITRLLPISISTIGENEGLHLSHSTLACSQQLSDHAVHSRPMAHRSLKSLVV